MEVEYLKPDLKFIKDVMTSGGDTLKSCYQCATCSVICPQSPDHNPFPRKEMIWSQWGLKDRLIKDPDVWLCHFCGDCTAHCPRGAKPGEVLNAIRRFSIAHYSTPGFLTNFVNGKQFLPVLFGIPTVIFLAYIFGVQGGLPPSSENIVFANLFPQIGFIDPLFGFLAIFVLASAGSGSLRFWKDMNAMFPPVRKKSIVGSVISTLADIFKHSKFRDCVVNADRYRAHLFTFYGFALLFITTAIIATLEWLSLLGIAEIGEHHSIIKEYEILGLTIHSSVTPLDNAIFKLIANAGAIVLLAGISLVAINRLKKEREERGAYFDWLLIGVILGVGLSGFLTELSRWGKIPPLAYSMYTIHLIFIFVLFAYLPFSKLAHLFYRTVALIYLDYSGRNEPVMVEDAAAEVKETSEGKGETRRPAKEEVPLAGEGSPEENTAEATESPADKS